MVTHIVFFAFKSDDSAAVSREAKERIEALAGKVPSVRHLEVGINFSSEERAMDLVLVTQFDDRAGLEAYATHPVHLEVIAWIKTVAEYTKVVDYES